MVISDVNYSRNRVGVCGNYLNHHSTFSVNINQRGFLNIGHVGEIVRNLAWLEYQIIKTIEVGEA